MLKYGGVSFIKNIVIKLEFRFNGNDRDIIGISTD